MKIAKPGAHGVLTGGLGLLVWGCAGPALTEDEMRDWEPLEAEPQSGWACNLETEPAGSPASVQSLSLYYGVGGDEDPTDDSRTVWLLPKETGIDLYAETGDIGTASKIASLVENKIYMLEIAGFTSGTTATQRSATLYQFSGPSDTSPELVSDFDLPLETESTWDIQDFVVAFGTGASTSDSALTTYMLDSDGADEYCVKFVLHMSAATGTDELQDGMKLRLDPAGSTPDVPKVTVEHFFDGRPVGGTANDDFDLVLRAREAAVVADKNELDTTDELQLRAGKLQAGSGLTVGYMGTAAIELYGSSDDASAVTDTTTQLFPPIGPAIYFETDASSWESGRLRAMHAAEVSGVETSKTVHVKVHKDLSSAGSTTP